MSADLLVCPGCRTYTHDAHGELRIDVRSLELQGELLGCACGRRYPVIDGVPIVLADPDSFFRAELATLVERDLPVEVAALLAASGPDDAPYPRLLEHLSIYLDALWGDRAEPRPDGPGVGFAAAAVVERIRERARDRVGVAVELGCSTGRIVAELAAGADRVIGVDLHFGSLRRARRLLAGETVTYARRVAGRHYTAATVAGERVVNAEVVCGDALDPPLVPGAFDRVVALNVLDSVRDPRQLLAVVDGLCRSGGEVILSSPYAWQSGVMDEAARLGGADPAGEVRRILREGDGLGARYHIEDEAELPWTLRRDARSAVAYCIHYVRARKTR
ncbi:MAG: methyltransferase domain-containing protein [Deltaproteobacteria bacterium]|nr:methyltransferase domain-containing protein [Deltaproteobacteria bacterium]